MSHETWFHRRLAQLTPTFAPEHTVPSPDGQWTATAHGHTSTDLLTWEIQSAYATPDPPPMDHLRDTYPSGIAWTPDGAGFFYDRLLPFSDSHGLYFHAVGTDQRQDHCVFYRAEHPDWFYQPHVSPDGRWLAVAILNGNAANRLSLLPLNAPGVVDSAHEITLIDRFTGRYDVVHWQADQLILRVVEPDAPNGRLIAVDLVTGARAVILPEQDLPLLDAAPLGTGWACSHLRQGHAELRWFNAHNAPTVTIPLPGLGTVDWLESSLETSSDPVHNSTIRHSAIRNSQSPLHFAYTDFARPPQIYRWRVGDFASQLLEDIADLPFDPADFVTHAHTVLGADGATIPFFLVHRRDLPLRNCPTLLTAYGGLGHTLTPRFSVDVLAWLELGGVYVSVCARGGGEMGATFHQAAVGAHKQRTFDDVLSVARRLTTQEITSPARLGLWGVSNGGLTAAACLIQAPDLFGAVVIESGLLDMLRYPHLGQGRQWLPEYGNPDDPVQRATVAAYSPLHNIQPGQSYPPTLIVTHEHDPRVGADHSLSFARALSEAQAGDVSIRLRVHPGSGHGAPTVHEAWLNWAAERLSFLAQHLGLTDEQ
ncbi:prolyl oligopeptidase family serine peptidase [bacterium]|nr:prolyl oligopeptidase family serine peptidase [bacterium]